MASAHSAAAFTFGHPRDVVEVHELDQVAELHSVDHLDVLVLVVEVLPRLGEPRRRVALTLEREVVAAAQVTVAPPDQPDVHAGQLERRHLRDEPAELAGQPVVLAADRLHERDLVRRSRRSGCPPGTCRTVNGSGLVPSKAWLAPTMSLLNMPWTSAPAAAICCGHEGRAVQALLLAVDGGEHDGAGELLGGEQPGQFEHHRDTGAVVVGAGRVAGEVQHVGARASPGGRS